MTVSEHVDQKRAPMELKAQKKICAELDTIPSQSMLDPFKLTITLTENPKKVLPAEELVFGKTFTDKLLTFHLSFLISCVFHYAFECFEGMKAYKDNNGKNRLFRPDRNMQRLNKSTSRIALPTVDEGALIKLIGEFVKVENRLIPQKRGCSLYLRPTVIGTQESLGVGAPTSALLFVIASPVGPYYPTGFKAISLEATNYAARAWPGGVGDKKLGANYAPCVAPQREAASRGFQQNLSLFGEDEYVTEVGTMNLFIALKGKDGQKELITAPIDGTILEGVTRDTLLQLARERLVPQGWAVSERKLRMQQISEAAEDGRPYNVK
ncbi:Branched-chain-amino-acid aminotransferase, mitochondrial [Aspergillus cristatus]|uniref:Branched-chain-amino-acid aminotransferase n=1 Tax=Aspergillus cristatus TaxID=573508 RepID=A0A1E3B9Q5_ASPCR|nr:Branched-chain-amino-acid aminotransferase, mitochondrial [Aspergillus cristatus]